MTNTCRACLEPLKTNTPQDIHPICYKKLFQAQKVSLTLPYDKRDVFQEVRIRSLRMSLTGGQPKVSLGIKKGELAMLDQGGTYILKPSTDIHPFISENEQLCMCIAKASGLAIPPLCLVQFKDGEYAFLIRRFDREKKTKIHIEDFCSVLDQYSEDKYEKSYLEIGRAVGKLCQNAGLDTLDYFHAVVLSYLLGNNDLHLKNFSLIESGKGYALAPHYDIVCAARYYPNASDMCLELIPDYLGSLENEGFYTQTDFNTLGKELSLNAAQITQVFNKLIKLKPTIQSLIKQSYLPEDEKRLVEAVILNQYKKFGDK